MRLDGAMAAPPRSLGGAGLESVPGDDEAVFALAAVVTREGRVANYEVLFFRARERPSATTLPCRRATSARSSTR